MKQVVAFIRPSKEDAVCQALHAIPGVSGASFTDIRGFGRGRHDKSRQQFDEAVVGTLPQVGVDVMVDSSVVAQVVESIVDHAHTGHRGDGKVYVVPLDSAVRISKKEAGATAV